MKSQLLIMMLVLSVQPALGAERSMITSRTVKKPDCTQLESQRASSEDYSRYAQCVVDFNMGAFTALFTRHLRDFPYETQDVQVKFTVATDGGVLNAAATAPGVTDAPYLQKIAARLKLVKFLPPEGQAREVTHTFLFSKYAF